MTTMPDDENKYADGLTLRVTLQLGFWDTVKVMLGGPIQVSIKTKTEHLIGKVKADWTHVYVERAKWMPKEKPQCFESSSHGRVP